MVTPVCAVVAPLIAGLLAHAFVVPGVAGSTKFTAVEPEK